jgi:uncharacterized protein (DUF885 family)
MLHRRSLLMLLAVAGLTRTARAETPPEAQRLHAFFDRLVQHQLQRGPENATYLGLDKGDLAPLKSRLSDASVAAAERDRRDNLAHLQALLAIDRAALRGIDVSSYDTVLFILQVQADGNRAIPYAGGSVSSPYIVSQLSGAYHDVPDFLDTAHSIADAADAEAYLARMEACAVVMDQELESVRYDAGLGVAPPDFIIDRTLIQMQAFHDTPAESSVLVNSLTRRAREAGLTADYRTRAIALYNDRILPALARQIAHFEDARQTATHEAGAARLPSGAEYYRLGLRNYTTSSLSPEQIHQKGLELVADLTAGLDTALKAQNYATGTVGERLAALTADPAQLYADTDAAKETLLADLNKKVAAVQAKLPQYFGTVPKARVEIHRVPKAIEAGAPGGYYQAGTLDGSRPGIYYINLRDSAEVPRFALPTLTFHEAIPGHHLQLTLAQETPGLPLIRKMIFFSAYGEGWALYAEQFAVEMGMYDSDPLGHIGQMKDALFRAVRLVIDTGLHAQGWSREKAVDYYVDNVGDKRSAAATEVERYCVWPGQACSYMVGKLTWLRLREQAKQALGARFDIRKFHDAGLLSGALPLDVLEQVIGQYITSTRA